MTIGNINIEETIKGIQEQINRDKSVSPTLVNSINLLIVVINLLISRLGLHSGNSSLPPSTDRPKRRRRVVSASKKKKSDKKPGGQEGHEGETLEQFDNPDEIIELDIDRRTLPSGVEYTREEPEARQVVDIALDFVVREYRAEVLVDSSGNRFVAEFPETITKAIQYGPSVKSLAVYLLQYQIVPYNRVQEVFKDQFGLEISQGSLFNFNKEAFEKLEGFELEMVKHLSKSSVLNADETGIKINGDSAWLHVLSNSKSTLYFPHVKRGKEAMDDMGVIKNFKGILCHDHWKPYLGYECQHALCNAHHLRELQWVIDFRGQKWAKLMQEFLLNLNERVDKYGGILPEREQEKQLRRYREIIRLGRGECPIYVKARGQPRRGKTKQSKERNLLDRLADYENEVLLFMKVKNVPFTNNQAERDIRMVKVQQKVAGQFRSMNGAKYFCRIRSYLMTVRKRGYSPYDKLCCLFDPEFAE